MRSPDQTRPTGDKTNKLRLLCLSPGVPKDSRATNDAGNAALAIGELILLARIKCYLFIYFSGRRKVLAFLKKKKKFFKHGGPLEIRPFQAAWD